MELLTEIRKHLRVAIEESGAKLTFDELPTIWGDEIQLGQLFQNLIANAIKFRQDKPPRIHISAVLREDGTVFSVKDDGIGIEQKYKDRIFVIFQRLHGKGEFPGTGLGLAICKKIVEQHGGTILF
jgi:chemotaxis family two-component system sensor kinase Cph1